MRTVFRVLGRLHRVRHGVVLGAVALAFLAANFRHVYLAAPGSFLVYGAVHASTLSAALRKPPPPWRTLVFVAAAALLSLTSAVLGMRVMHLSGVFSQRSAARIALSVAALFGALSYTALIRVSWMPDLAVRSIVVIALGCALAALAASLLGIYAIGGGGVYIAVAWWCAMSAGLCHQDRGRE